MKTHVVIDLESQEGILAGTLQECEDFISSQSDYFMYSISQMTPQEIEFENK